MAISRRDFPLNSYGLTTQIRKRINELVSLQLTPTTINLFTAEFSKMDEEIKINIGMYIAQLLEIENALLEQHFDNLRQVNSHGNSRDHLIMEQRRANLMRIQQIFTQEVQRQERIGDQMALKSQYEAQMESSLGTLDIKSAMVTNPSKMSLLEMERVHQAQVANIRRNKELYDFEVEQVQKLLARFQAENNVQKILELQNRIKIIEQEYLLRRDSMLRTINVHQQQMDVQANREGKKSTTKKVAPKQQQIIPQIMVPKAPANNPSDLFESEGFFDVDTIEINNVSNGKKPKPAGKNVESKIPNEVLSDSTIAFDEIKISSDISNPNENSPLSEIDRILEETENKTITTKKAEKENDPFLLLLARDQELKQQKSEADKNLLEAAAQTKAFREAIINKTGTIAKKEPAKKTGTKKPAVKKQLEEDSATTSSETKKINDEFRYESSFNRVNTNQNQYKSTFDGNKVRQQQEIIQLKNEQLKFKDERFRALQDEKRDLLKRINALEKKEANQKPIKEIQVREVIVKDDSAIKELKNENKMLVKRLQNLETALKKDNERLKQNKSKDIETKEYINRIKTLEKENDVLAKSLNKKTEIDEKAQQKKAQRAVNSLRSLYVERLKGVNLLNSLRSKQKVHYENISKDTHVRDEASAALNNLFIKQKAHIAKSDLVKKEKVQELKHDILVSEDVKAISKPTQSEIPTPIIDLESELTSINSNSNSNVSVVDDLINDMIDKTEPYSNGWKADDSFDDDLIAIDKTELVIDSSVFDEELMNAELTNTIPTERFILEEEQKREMKILERKAKLKLISENEMNKLKIYQEKFKKDKGLKAYRLITTYKKDEN